MNSLTPSKKTPKPRLVNKVDRRLLLQQMQQNIEPRTTLSFYRYHRLENPSAFRNELFQKLDALQVMGRIYVASEGINAQISIPTTGFDQLKEVLYSYHWLDNTRLNVAVDDDGKSFYKLRITVKNKLVADGLNDDTFDVTNRGTHLNAVDFNEMTDRPNTILVDMRNHYETEVGYFEGAILPDVTTFREALPVVSELLAAHKDKNIVMYCTGGIRCEKASAYYKHHGFEHVFQLEGGIIEYARQAEAQGLENKFRGVNFVFDERLGERISSDIVSKCHQCGSTSDRHVNCVNDACHLLFIQCERCAEKFQNSCGAQCHEHISLPEETRLEARKNIVFNGFKYGKGRYRSFNGSELLK